MEIYPSKPLRRIMNQESRIKKIKNKVKSLIHNSLFMIRKSQKGFTLIELLIVLSVTAFLGTLGIAGFTAYNQVQILQSSTNDVVTILNLAKSRAQSQVKLSVCSSSEMLAGYKVEILAPKNYTLYLRCSGSDRKVEEEAKVLVGDLRFDSSISFFFPVQSGGVQAPGTITITHSGNGRHKTITVNSLGGVSTQ